MANEEAHWNTIAPAYDQEIFNVFTSDKFKRLPKYFKKHGNPKKLAIDFGCGNGKSFPYIAPKFKKIIAVDISQELLNQAEKRPYKNIEFKQLDLTKSNLKLPFADFIFCCNVAMLPEVEKTHAMILNIQKALRVGGTALLVLPSLDSVLYASWRLMEMYRRNGVKTDEIPSDEFDYFNASKRDIVQGIIHIDGVPTKHWGQSELEVVFKNAGLTITAIDKVEYDWDTELDSPPQWMKEPYPWDWLVECKKK
jgi:SAM-dependent methyltransferase